MAVTRLKRKSAKNKSRAKARVKTIGRLNSSPVIKRVTPEEIKAQFSSKKEAPKAKKKEEVKEAKEEAPKAEKKAAKETSPSKEEK